MTCGEVHKFAYAYIDGEFDERERGELEAHLSLCSPCRRMIDFEGWFQETLRQSMPHEQAPRGLEDRIRAALDKADGATALPVVGIKRVLSGYLGSLLKPVPALALAGVLAFFLWPTLGSHPPVLEEAVERHRRDLPVEVTGPDDAVVRTWFRGKVDFPVHLPQFHAPTRANLLGARLSHFRDRHAAYVVYDVEGAKLSVMVFNGQGLPQPGGRIRRVGERSIHLHSANGYNVAMFRDKGVTYTMTSELDENEMVRLVSSSLDAIP